MNNILNKIQGDRVIWLVILLLSVFSILAVYSSTGTLAYKYQGGNTEYYLLKHLGVIASGIILVFGAHLIDYRYYSRIAQLLLYISIPLLLYTLLFGTNINDAKRWITLPVINLTFQTSDLAKLALIMYTARMLSKKQEKIKEFNEAFVPILLPVAIVVMLIAPEDLSTAIVLFATCLLLMFIGRVALRYILGLMGTSMIFLAIFFTIMFAVPEESLEGKLRMLTWKNRIESFISSDSEIPYQVQQANIAIAKGGILPNGPGNSAQKNFLPHPYSDFIYAIIIEEYGLIGGAFIVLLYLLFLSRSIRIVLKSPKAFGALLAVGLALSLVIQAMINMGVAVNLLPVTGMTLPLVSMGGSSIWFTSLAIGIILSVSRHIENLELENTELLEPQIAE